MALTRPPVEQKDTPTTIKLQDLLPGAYFYHAWSHLLTRDLWFCLYSPKGRRSLFAGVFDLKAGKHVKDLDLQLVHRQSHANYIAPRRVFHLKKGGAFALCFTEWGQASRLLFWDTASLNALNLLPFQPRLTGDLYPGVFVGLNHIYYNPAGQGCLVNSACFSKEQTKFKSPTIPRPNDLVPLSDDHVLALYDDEAIRYDLHLQEQERIRFKFRDASKNVPKAVTAAAASPNGSQLCVLRGFNGMTEFRLTLFTNNPATSLFEKQDTRKVEERRKRPQGTPENRVVWLDENWILLYSHYGKNHLFEVTACPGNSLKRVLLKIDETRATEVPWGRTLFRDGTLLSFPDDPKTQVGTLYRLESLTEQELAANFPVAMPSPLQRIIKDYAAQPRFFPAYTPPPPEAETAVKPEPEAAPEESPPAGWRLPCGIL